MELFSREHYEEVLVLLAEDSHYLREAIKLRQRDIDIYETKLRSIKLDMDRIMERQSREGKT